MNTILVHIRQINEKNNFLLISNYFSLTESGKKTRNF